MAQEELHRKKTFREEYMIMLQKSGIDFNENICKKNLSGNKKMTRIIIENPCHPGFIGTMD